MNVDWFQTHIILGIVSSAAAGTEDLGRASRSAIVSYVHDQPEVLQMDMCILFFTTLLDQLEVAAEDRLVVPTMEVLAFLIEQDVLIECRTRNLQDYHSMLLQKMQKVHQPSSSLQRVEAALRIYSCLAVVQETRTKALEKLTRMLLHRHPKVKENPWRPSLTTHELTVPGRFAMQPRIQYSSTQAPKSSLPVTGPSQPPR